MDHHWPLEPTRVDAVHAGFRAVLEWRLLGSGAKVPPRFAVLNVPFRWLVAFQVAGGLQFAGLSEPLLRRSSASQDRRLEVSFGLLFKVLKPTLLYQPQTGPYANPKPCVRNNPTPYLILTLNPTLCEPYLPSRVVLVDGCKAQSNIIDASIVGRRRDYYSSNYVQVSWLFYSLGHAYMSTNMCIRLHNRNVVCI